MGKFTVLNKKKISDGIKWCNSTDLRPYVIIIAGDFCCDNCKNLERLAFDAIEFMNNWPIDKEPCNSRTGYCIAVPQVVSEKKIRQLGLHIL